MHIPDGFLDVKTFSVLYSVSAVTIGVAIKKLNKNLSEKQIPMLGVLAAFVFAAQMLNFPVAGGTSGHFMGGVLISILLGPMSGLLIMSTVLIVQCFIFQDGGLTSLGANVFNMGIIGSIAGYYIYKGLKKIFSRTISTFIACWISIIMASSFCAAELAISGIVPLKLVFLAMVSVHALIGVGEGLITVTVLSFVSKVRPDLLELEKI
ncbi:MAG: cobalt transporter CbiM [Elusimicrobia bacterium]|nr:cobalt transporter CbiM [Elusimicrobiota bacterium]